MHSNNMGPNFHRHGMRVGELFPSQEQGGRGGERSMVKECSPPEQSSGWCRYSTGSYPLTLGEWRRQLRRHSNISDDPLRVETQRYKGAKRAASWKLHIDDGCMGGGEAIDYLPVLAWSMGRNSVCMPGSDNDFWDVKWGNGWDVDLDYHSAWKNLDHHYGYWWNYR